MLLLTGDVGASDNPRQGMYFQTCETTIVQYLHHLMCKQHTCSKWAQQARVCVFAPKRVLLVPVSPLTYPKFTLCARCGKSTLQKITRQLLLHLAV